MVSVNLGLPSDQDHLLASAAPSQTASYGAATLHLTVRMCSVVLRVCPAASACGGRRPVGAVFATVVVYSGRVCFLCREKIFVNSPVSGVS